MAILIKKAQKVVNPVQLVAEELENITVDASVLEDVGFLEDKPVGKYARFAEGQRVMVTLPPYPWTTIWKLGDVGTVKRVWEAAREFKVIGEWHGVVAVQMDVVRHVDWPTLFFCDRYLELVP